MKNNNKFYQREKIVPNIQNQFPIFSKETLDPEKVFQNKSQNFHPYSAPFKKNQNLFQSYKVNQEKI